MRRIRDGNRFARSFCFLTEIGRRFLWMRNLEIIDLLLGEAGHVETNPPYPSLDKLGTCFTKGGFQNASLSFFSFFEHREARTEWKR